MRNKFRIFTRKRRIGLLQNELRLIFLAFGLFKTLLCTKCITFVFAHRMGGSFTKKWKKALKN